MQQPPDPYPQYPQQQWQQSEALPPQYPQQMPPPHWQQPPMPPQQPQYPYYQRLEPQYAPPPEQPPAPPAQKPKKRFIGCILAIGCGSLVACLLIVIISAGSQSTQETVATQTAQDVNQAATAAAQVSASPAGVSPAELEATYKASTHNFTVTELDKAGNTDKNVDVHFTATINDFVKDDSGNTVASNVNDLDPNTSSVILVDYPEHMDYNRVNENDTIEVWGYDTGTISGHNAYGATIQEVAIVALYITDKTTGYQAG